MFPFCILVIYFGPEHKNIASLLPSLSALCGEYILTQSVDGLERVCWLVPHKFLPSCNMWHAGGLLAWFFDRVQSRNIHGCRPVHLGKGLLSAYMNNGFVPGLVFLNCCIDVI